MTRFRKLSTTLLFLSATALAGAAVLSAPALAAKGGIPGPNPDAPGQIKKANGPTVNTADGPVRGFVENGVNKFLGIPYAAPPVGDLRWMPPAPAAHHALLDATEFANTCPQVTELGRVCGPNEHHRGLPLSQCLHDRDQPSKSRSWSGFTAAEILTVKPTTTTGASSPQAGHWHPHRGRHHKLSLGPVWLSIGITFERGRPSLGQLRHSGFASRAPLGAG